MAIKSILKQETAAVSTGNSSNEISWGDLEIYEFKSILGDNPAASGGSPLTLAWKHESKSVVAIEIHEFLRQNHRPSRRRKDMIMQSGARDAL